MKFHAALVFAAIAGVPMLLSGCGETIEKYVSPQAIDGFIKIDSNEHWMDEYCEGYLTVENLTANIWWPGCGIKKKISEFDTCDKDGCITKAMMQEMDDFNKKYGGELVSYKSRAGKDDDGKDIDVVGLTGWWLPAPDADASTPRIVVQHGFTSNSNKFREQYIAFLLRKLGFSVLINNLRDHCYSDSTDHGIVGWGHAYPLDELGAVDFARDGVDKPIDSSKVGILGFSMGGFTTANAFGVGKDVPAAWIDGAPITPKAGFEQGFRDALPHESLEHLLTDSVWEDVEQHAEKEGVNLNGHLPEKELPEGPDTKRPVFVTANKGDKTVPFSSSEELVKILKKHPEKYNLVEFWQHEGKCLEDDTHHCIDHVINPKEYSAKLCSFWSSVFKTDPTCGQSNAGDDKDEKNGDGGKVEEKVKDEKNGDAGKDDKKDDKDEKKGNAGKQEKKDDKDEKNDDSGKDVKKDGREKLYEEYGSVLRVPSSRSGLIVASLLGVAGFGLGVVALRRTRHLSTTRELLNANAEPEEELGALD